MRIRAVLRRGATLKSDVKEILMRNKGSIVPRMVLLEHVWDMNSDPLPNSLEAHVFSVRKKLGSRGRAALRNVQGRDYLFEE